MPDLRAALAGVADGVWDLDLRTTSVWYSPDWYLALGYAPADLPSESQRLPWPALVHPDDCETLRAALAAHLDGRAPTCRAELRMRGPDEQWRWVVSRGKVVERAADGSPVRVIGTYVDISAWKDLAQRYESAERRHRALLQSLPDLTVLVRRDGTILDCHAAGETVPAVTPGDLRHRNLREVLPAEVAARALELSATALDENRPVVHEYALVRGGETRHFEARIAPYDRDTVATLVRDVTDCVEAQHRVRSVEERLRQAERLQAIGQLASGIAHDFNNQMNSIIFLGDMLCKGATDPEAVRRYAQMMVRRAASSSELTRKLLGLARRTSVQPARFDLQALVREVVTLLQYTFDKSVRIGTEFGAPAVWISADRSRIENALLNLAINARDAMPGGGSLLFRIDTAEREAGHCRVLGTAIHPGRYARVSVEDTGCGMDAATLSRIFDPFYSTKAPQGGWGLGLSGVADTVRALNGWIEVESTPGRGTRFALGFPLEDGPSEAAAEAATAAAGGAPGAGRRVMLVDDEDLFREVVGEHLRRMGFGVTLCAGGAEAIAEFARPGGGFDVVILDVVMARLDGLQVLSRLRGVDAAARVLLVSGNPPSGALAAAVVPGQVAFLRKPFTPEALAAAIMSLLPRPR